MPLPFVSNIYNRLNYEGTLTTIRIGLVACLILFVNGATLSFSTYLPESMDSEKSPFYIGPNRESWITSIIEIGSMAGSMLAAFLPQWLGRKSALLISCFPFAFGYLLIISSPNANVMYAGRFITGIGCSLAFGTAIIYITEIAPTKIRGSLTEITFTISAIGAALSNWYSSTMGTYVNWNWIGVTNIGITLLSALAVCTIPETPRWLLSKAKREPVCAKAKMYETEAINVLKKLRNNYNIDAELNVIRQTLKGGRQPNYVSVEDEEQTRQRLQGTVSEEVDGLQCEGSAAGDQQNTLSITNGVLKFMSPTQLDDTLEDLALGDNCNMTNTNVDTGINPSTIPGSAFTAMRQLGNPSHANENFVQSHQTGASTDVKKKHLFNPSRVLQQLFKKFKNNDNVQEDLEMGEMSQSDSKTSGELDAFTVQNGAKKLLTLFTNNPNEEAKLEAGEQSGTCNAGIDVKAVQGGAMKLFKQFKNNSNEEVLELGDQSEASYAGLNVKAAQDGAMKLLKRLTNNSNEEVSELDEENERSIGSTNVKTIKGGAMKLLKRLTNNSNKEVSELDDQSGESNSGIDVKAVQGGTIKLLKRFTNNSNEEVSELDDQSGESNSGIGVKAVQGGTIKLLKRFTNNSNEEVSELDEESEASNGGTNVKAIKGGAIKLLKKFKNNSNEEVSELDDQSGESNSGIGVKAVQGGTIKLLKRFTNNSNEEVSELDEESEASNGGTNVKAIKGGAMKLLKKFTNNSNEEVSELDDQSGESNSGIGVKAVQGGAMKLLKKFTNNSNEEVSELDDQSGESNSGIDVKAVQGGAMKLLKKFTNNSNEEDSELDEESEASNGGTNVKTIKGRAMKLLKQFTDDSNEEVSDEETSNDDEETEKSKGGINVKAVQGGAMKLFKQLGINSNVDKTDENLDQHDESENADVNEDGSVLLNGVMKFLKPKGNTRVGAPSHTDHMPHQGGGMNTQNSANNHGNAHNSHENVDNGDDQDVLHLLTRMRPILMALVRQLFWLRTLNRTDLFYVFCCVLMQTVYTMNGTVVINLYSVQIFKISRVNISADAQAILLSITRLVSALLCAFTFDRLGRKWMTFTSLMVQGVCTTALATYYYVDLKVNHVYAEEHLFWLPLAGMLLFELVLQWGSTSVLLMSIELFSTDKRSGVSGLVSTWRRLAAFLVAYYFDRLVIKIGLFGAFWLSSGFCVMGALFYFFIVPDTQNKSLEEIQNDIHVEGTENSNTVC
ncbi:hypothetical protein CHUAL_005784 [Chamberlinius hualienensis]